MKYFNGFSLRDEENLFLEYIDSSDTTVVGFSFGAQKALEYVYDCNGRVDRLILLSPAFFENEKQSFIRMQLHYFALEQKSYIQQFLSNVSYPSNLALDRYIQMGTKEELESLLNYVWDKNKIEKILQRGTTIEVFLGEEDKIINTKEVLHFFSPLVSTYYIKNVGHLLREKDG